MTRVPTAEDILGADDLPLREVAVPEWGEDAVVYVATLTGEEAEGLQGIDKEPNFLGRFVALVSRDGLGRPLFTREQAEALAKKNQTTLRRISDAAQDHNAMTKAAQEERGKN